MTDFCITSLSSVVFLFEEDARHPPKFADRVSSPVRTCRRLRQRGESKVRDTFGERHTNPVTPK